jgi:hypothetical protein
MKYLFLTLFTFGMLATAHAKVISGNTQFVKVEIQSVTLEVEAKCEKPQFEDDSFHLFFSPDSYSEVNPYLKDGYSLKLVDRTCGNLGKGAKLSETDFETVTVFLVNGDSARQALEDAIESVWTSVK